MKITGFRLRVVRFPLDVPLRPSWAPGRLFEYTTSTIIEVDTDEGVSGVGAAPDTGLIGLTTISDMVAPYLIGMDPFAVERIAPILRNAARDGSYPWAVETAIWDIIGKAAGLPVVKMWGSYSERLPAYASLAEIVEPIEQIRRIEGLRALGFKAFKIRLGRASIRQDIEAAEEIRAGVSADVSLMADANQAHKMPCPGPYAVWGYQDALEVASALSSLGFLWLEEPLPRYAYDQIARLTRETRIPIAGGELNLGLHEYREMIRRGCYDIIQADAAFSEGVFQLRKVASAAEMDNLPFIPHTWSNGVGLAANLHLAGALPNCSWFEFPVDPPAWTVEARDFMLLRPFSIEKDGSIQVPDSPGMGIELNHETIDRFTVARWSSETLEETISG